MNKSENLVNLPSSEWLWWKQSSAPPFSPRCGLLQCTGPSLSRSCDLAASHLEQGRSAPGVIMPVYLLAWSPRPSVSTFPNLSLCCNVNLIIRILQGFLNRWNKPTWKPLNESLGKWEALGECGLHESVCGSQARMKGFQHSLSSSYVSAPCRVHSRL